MLLDAAIPTARTFLEVLLEYKFVFGGASAFVLGCIKYWKTIKLIFRRVNIMLNVLSKLDTMDLKLNTITSELKTNGGSSLRDAVNRISSTVAVIDNRQRIQTDNSETACFQLDNDGDMVYINKRMIRLIGRSEKELMYSGWINSVVYELRNEVEREWQRLIKEERDFELRTEILHADGNKFKVTIEVYRMQGSLGYIGNLKPIFT